MSGIVADRSKLWSWIRSAEAEASRRSVLRTAVATGLFASGSVLAFSISPWLALPTVGDSLAAHIRRRASNLFTDRDAARVLGNLYLGDYPEEADVQRLLWLLTSGAEACAGDHFSAQEIDGWLASRIARDLRNGDVVLLAGWLMARSEARLCVLADLVGPSHD